MACRTCPDCGIDYPPSATFHTCIACGLVTTYRPLHAQDMDWKPRAEAIAARLDTLANEELWEIPHVDAQVTVDEEGLHWLSSHDAIRAGTTNHLTMSETDVVTIGYPDERDDHPDGNFYEVIAYVDKKRAYWVRPLRVPDVP